MVDMFKRSKFFLCVAQKQNYEDGIVFTENNIVSYLAELEEYISSLITYSAFKRDEPNAAIASIPLDRLTAKDFQQRNTAVSKFNNTLIIDFSYLISHISYSPICQSIGPPKKVQSKLALQQQTECHQPAEKETFSTLESCLPSSQAMWKIIESNSNSTIITGIKHRISIIRKRTMSVFHEIARIYKL